MRKLFMLILLTMLLAGCLKPKNTENRHQILTICNKLDRDVYFKQGNREGNLPYYNPMLSPEFYLLRANDCIKEYDDGFESLMEYSAYNRLTYYFFDPEVLRTVPWDTVYQHRMFLGVRHYTKPMLDSLDWRVEFP